MTDAVFRILPLTLFSCRVTTLANIRHIRYIVIKATKLSKYFIGISFTVHVFQVTYRLIYRLRSSLVQSTATTPTTTSYVASSTVPVCKWASTSPCFLTADKNQELMSRPSLPRLHSTSFSHHETSPDTLAVWYANQTACMTRHCLIIMIFVYFD